MRLHQRFVRYFLTAGAAAIVDVGGYALLSLTPLPRAPGAVASFALATAFLLNFWINLRVVFRRSAAYPHRMPRGSSGTE